MQILKLNKLIKQEYPTVVTATTPKKHGDHTHMVEELLYEVKLFKDIIYL